MRTGPFDRSDPSDPTFDTRILIRILPFRMRLWIRILPFTLIGTGSWLYAQNLKICSNRLIFHIFWLVICKWKRIRVQLITLMRIRIQLITCDADPDAGPDPTFQSHAAPVSDPQHIIFSNLVHNYLPYLCDVKMFPKF
jgi:hypothetical protein